jgi:hypothetical protein
VVGFFNHGNESSSSLQHAEVIRELNDLALLKNSDVTATTITTLD